MMRFITMESDHPALVADRLFFELHPYRQYRARALAEGECHLEPVNIDPGGNPGEVNLTIIKRIDIGRIRCFFASGAKGKLKTDKQVAEFLRSRGIDPAYFGMRRMIGCH